MTNLLRCPISSKRHKAPHSYNFQAMQYKTTIKILCVLLLYTISQARIAQLPVTVSDHAFSPAVFTVSQSDTVVWTCLQGTHNIHELSNPSAFNGGNPRSAPWHFTFVTEVAAQTCQYQCDPHAPDMSGLIHVQAASGIHENPSAPATSFKQ